MRDASRLLLKKQLKPAESRYPATEIEGLVVVRGIRHFTHYLTGCHTSVLR